MGNYLGYSYSVLHPIRCFDDRRWCGKPSKYDVTVLGANTLINIFSQDQPTSAFRIPWGVQIVPAVILFFGMFFLPRSPRWLASKDRWEEAIKVIADLHGGGNVNHPKVLAEYQEIEEALRFEREEAISSYKQLVAPRMIKRVVLGMSIQMWSQLCGMNIMMYYVVCKYFFSAVVEFISNSSFRYHARRKYCQPAYYRLDSIHPQCVVDFTCYHLP